MKHPASLALHAYWTALAGDRTAPERSDVDPTVIRHLLAHVFFLSVEVDRVAVSRAVTFRQAGTRVSALFKCDLDGNDFASIVAPSDAATTDLMLDATLDDRTATVAAARAAPPGRAALDLELLLLPLRHRGKTHARILGSLAAFDAPVWLGACSAAPLRILSFRTMGSRQRPSDANGAPVLLTGGHPPFGGLLRMVAPDRRFRVVEGGLSTAFRTTVLGDPSERSL